MTLSLIIAGLTVFFMVCSILIKPYIRIGKFKVGLYCIICLTGAVFSILLNAVGFPAVIKGITLNNAVNPLKILTLFISMTMISVYLDDSGFFEYCAQKVFVKSKGNTRKLFFALFALVSVLTVFTSNDIIILTFTPFICLFCKKAEISPIPFLFCEFISANTWSMALIVGNPTNIYLAGSANISFFEYFKVMALPALCGGLLSFATLYLIFRKQLSADTIRKTSELQEIKLDKIPMIVSLSVLVLCIVLLSVCSFLGLEMWIICALSFIALSIFNLIYGLVKGKGLQYLKPIKRAPFELIPFVLSMFVLVLALDNCGFTNKLNEILITNTEKDGISIGVLSALCSNLLNNIPMSVLFEKIISGNSIFAVYGAIIGSNIGAFITPVGALAGIMWTKILASYGEKMNFLTFIKYGILPALVSLLSSTLALFIVL